MKTNETFGNLFRLIKEGSGKTDSGFSVSFETDDSMAVKVEGSDGEGTMTFYYVFDGVYLIYNDFHMSECFSPKIEDSDVLCIDHCREGRIEKSSKNGAFSYTERGDMRIDTFADHEGLCRFPLSHYHGVTIALQVGRAERSLKKEFPTFSIDIRGLLAEFCGNNEPFAIRGEPTVEHLFSQLYQIPGKVQLSYFKIKIMELLIYLSALEIDPYKVERPYFYGEQVEKVKAARELITRDLTRSYTIKELSEIFIISETALKRCFKSIYGSPVHTYLKHYRIQQAISFMFRDRNLKISEIGAMVGYNSPGKFTAAFREITGKTPLEYKKSHGLERKQ